MIRLRPLKISDCEKMTDWLAQERQFAMWSAGNFKYPLTKEQLVCHAQKLETDNSAWSMAALDEKGTLVGHVMIKKADYEKNSVHLGHIVVDPSKRGMGYGKEMVTKAVQYAFAVLGVQRVTLNVIEANTSAYACYTSIGFKEEARTEKAYQYQDEDWTVCLMALQKSL